VGLAFRDGNPLPVGCSAHLFSRDGLNWTMSAVAAHNASVALAGGGERQLYRQRPKVLVEGGKIIALFGGVMPCGEAVIRPGARSAELGHCTTDRPPPNPHRRRLSGTGITGPSGCDNSWTSVVPLATAASRLEDSALKADDDTVRTAAAPHPHLKYMSVMGFNPSAMQGWVNFGLQAIGDGNCKFAGRYDCNLTGALDAWSKYQIPSIYGNIPHCSPPVDEHCQAEGAVFVRGVGLAPGWEAHLEAVVKLQILPNLGEGKALRGVFLGDEICCMNTTCWDAALRPATEKLRTLVGTDTLIYTK
jgi:hypothetical protein